MDLVSVLTCPKRPQYLLSTLDQLDREGARGVPRMVFSDGPIVDLDTTWGLAIKEDGPSGTAPAMRWVFEVVVSTGADRLLYAEDDLIVGRDAVTRMLATQVPNDAALVTGFDLSEFRPPNIPAPGLYPVRPTGKLGTGLWGTLFCLIPRRTIEWVLADNDKGWGDRNKPCDGLLGKVLERSPWPRYMMRVPSDVDHAGVESTLVKKRPRSALHFVGARSSD